MQIYQLYQAINDKQKRDLPKGIYTLKCTFIIQIPIN